MKTPIKLDIEAGAEWLLPAAKRWLEQAKRAMRTPLGAKVFDLPSGEKVTVQWRQGLDYVRISGGKVWYPVGVALPNPYPYAAAPTATDTQTYAFSGTDCGGGWPSIVRYTRSYSDGSSCGCEGELRQDSTYCTVGSSGAWTDTYTGYPVVNGFTTDGFIGYPGYVYNGPPAFASGNTTITIISGQISGNIVSVVFSPDEYYQGMLSSLSVLTVPWETAEEATARRVALFLGNSDDVKTAMSVSSFSTPTTWDYAIKHSAPLSNNTYREQLITSTITTTTISDTSNNLTQPGVKISRRTAQLSYGAELGTVEGTLTETVTGHYTNDTLVLLSRIDTYDNWYSGDISQPPSGASTASKLRNAALVDGSAHGFGLVWSGEYTAAGSYFSDSAFGAPDTGYPGVTYSPPQPAYRNTLVGALPAFVSQYRTSVPIKYDESGTLASAAWNDSAMQGITELTLIIFSPVKDGISLGMFSSVSDRTGATEFQLEGRATFTYKHATGSVTFSKLTQIQPGVRFQVPLGVPFPSYNSIVLYTGVKWKDVVLGAKQLKTDLLAGVADKFMAAVLVAAGEL